MILFFAGDIHGCISLFYRKVKKLEQKLRVKADWILQTGNFGIWPDPMCIDRQTRKHGQGKDFHRYYLENLGVPSPTLFVAGKHEDHRWMNAKFSRSEMELLPNLHWLVNGYKTEIGTSTEQLSVVGLGKVFSPTTFRGERLPAKRRLSHYTRGEVERACSQGPTDILLIHEAMNPTTEAIVRIDYAIRPKIIVHGGSNSNPVIATTCRNVTKSPVEITQVFQMGSMEIMAFSVTNKEFTPID